MLKCGDGTYYTGYTVDLINRHFQHCMGKGAKYTKGRRPLSIVYYEICDTKSKAMKREYEIKQFTRKKKEKLIYGPKE